MFKTSRIEFYWELLKKSVAGERLGHAYIFSGNDIKTKREFAYNLTQVINCKSEDRTKTPCKQCGNCIAIHADRFADFILIQPDQSQSNDARGNGEIKIAQIRSLIELISLGTWISSYKVVIIEAADTMNSEAQSAFLKLLEEPKGNTLFMLFADHGELLLETIRSRTQVIKFYAYEDTKKSTKVTPLEALKNVPLYKRFAYAKQLSDAPQKIPDTLHEWLWEARGVLLHDLKIHPSNVSRLVSTLSNILETAKILQSTNANSRLALERLLLNI